MLLKYKCRVKPTLDSKLFSYFENALGRRRILDKWFYFYINQPEKPVVIWKLRERQDWQLQPGTNRYIGTALRNSGEWLDAILITDELEESPEIKIIQAIGRESFTIDPHNFYDISLDNPAHVWGIENQTLYNPEWIQPVYDWIHSKLKYRWGLEHNGKLYYVNSERRLTSLFKKTKEIVHSQDYNSLQDAVQDLFAKIKLNEF